jgi:hypothetical protein
VPVGLDSITARIASGLLLSELRAQGIAVVDRRDVTPTESPQEAARLAGSDVEMAVYGSLSQLGNRILAEVNVVKVATAEIVYSDRLTSQGTEDLETVMRRLAKGVATGKKMSETATVENITEAEAQTPRRRVSFSSVGLKVGYLWPTADSWGGVPKMTAVDFVYRYETAKWELEITPLSGFRVGSTEQNSAFDWVLFDFSYHYFLTLTDISPYLGGGLGFHSIHAWEEERSPSGEEWYWNYERREDSGTGFGLNVGGGLVLFRTYDFHLTADLRYQYIAHELKKLEHGQAQGFIFTIGFAYARGRHGYVWYNQ